MEGSNEKVKVITVSPVIGKELAEYQSHLKELVVKSQDSFEKLLTYISAGSLSISIAFIKEVVGNLNQTHHEGILVLSWGLMGFTLLLNLLSHVFTSNCHNKTIAEISDGKYNYTETLCRHNNIKKMNFVSIGSLILGITSLLVFISLNI